MELLNTSWGQWRENSLWPNYSSSWRSTQAIKCFFKRSVYPQLYIHEPSFRICFQRSITYPIYTLLVLDKLHVLFYNPPHHFWRDCTKTLLFPEKWDQIWVSQNSQHNQVKARGGGCPWIQLQAVGRTLTGHHQQHTKTLNPVLVQPFSEDIGILLNKTLLC